MRNIFLIAGITFKDSIRKKALMGIFFFGLALFLANIIISGMFSWELGKVAVDVGLSVVALSGLMIIFFFSIHMVSQDLERKTIYMILSRPITKPQYILGKYCGLALIILISTAVLGTCSILSVKLATLGAEAFIPHMFSWSIFFLGLIYLTLSLLLILGLAFLCVSVTTHPFTAILLCLMTYFIGQNAETVLKVITRSKMFDQNPALLKIIQTVHWVFPNLAAFDLKTTAAYGLDVDAAYLLWVALYGLAYLGICLVLSIAIFNRRELG
jgi:ABC-type transport system involved in multi-copper enzyme maturation permease subunit